VFFYLYIAKRKLFTDAIGLAPIVKIIALNATTTVAAPGKVQWR
jgi:hypothetical protein